MLLVEGVTGPAAAQVGDVVMYRVSAFNTPRPRPPEAAAVRWLIKSTDGGALAHITGEGPTLELTVPDAWRGHNVLVMPYLKSPSARIAVRTAIADTIGRPASVAGARHVEVFEENGRYYASVDGEPRFFVGIDVRYGARRGLMNAANPPGPRYQPQDYEAAHGDWAWYLFPTILCESRGHFACLNTYDRAAFTFGHIQLAAHTPDDNFVAFFREILGDPPSAEYFPDLRVDNGRIQRLTAAGAVALESAASTAGLMAYLNASSDRVDRAEAERAARIIDWCLRYPAMRDAQVAFAVRQQRRKLRRHAAALPLDATVDKLCLVVLDILHQGRAKYPAIRAALASPDPFDALLGIGASTDRDRLATLRAAIRDLEALGRVGTKVYDAASGEFALPLGA